MDIDRFSRALLEQWLAQLGVSNTDVAARGTGEDDGERNSACVGVTVARSRAACRLKHLIGAAPVCWGVPLLVHRPNVSAG